MGIGKISIVADALKIAVDLVRGVGGEFRWHFEGQDGLCIYIVFIVSMVLFYVYKPGTHIYIYSGTLGYRLLIMGQRRGI